MYYLKALKTYKQLLAILLIAPLLAFLPAGYAFSEAEETDVVETKATDSDSGSDPDSTTSEPTTSKKAVIKQRVLPNIALKRSQSLLEHMQLFDREDEVITLETENESFYGLFLEEESGNPQGAILILHDNQQHGHWPKVIAPIREYLPQFGWTTLAIELPDTPARTRTPREIAKPTQSSEESTSSTNNTENNSADEENQTDDPADSDETAKITSSETELETEAEKDAEPALPRLQELPVLTEDDTQDANTSEDKELSPKIIYQQQNANRIISAVNHLKSLNQLNIVILGHGTGAAWAVDYIQKQDKDSAEATTGLTLITIDALTSQFTPQKMHEQIKDIKVPYLDLIHPEKTRAVLLAKKRLRILKRTKTADHQQFITPVMSGYGDNESPTNRRIRGWLMNNAAGSVVKAVAK